MSEILDPTQEDELFQKLCENECGKKVFIPSEDPIGLYNHVVKQFNALCNKTTDSSFEKLDTNCFYSIWMLRWWTMIRADTNLIFLVLSFIFNFVIGLVPIVNLVEFVMWLIVYLIYERTYKIHGNVNKKISPDPLRYMIPSNDLCKKAGLLNIYYEMPVSSLGTIGLRETQIEMIKSRRNGNTAIFMVYSDRFKYAYTRFEWLRYIHIVHIVISAVGILIANLLIYPKTGINEFFQT
jgi:hypothetical protein